MKIGWTFNMGLVALLVACVAVFYRQQQFDARFQQFDARIKAVERHAAQITSEQREACAEQSAKAFHRLGYDQNQTSESTSTFTNHFNPKLSRCFIEVETTLAGRGSVSIGRALFDAHEQRQYADYMWVSSQTKYWEQPPMLCRLTPNANDEHTCHTEQEYKDFVARYME